MKLIDIIYHNNVDTFISDTITGRFSPGTWKVLKKSTSGDENIGSCVTPEHAQGPKTPRPIRDQDYHHVIGKKYAPGTDLRGSKKIKVFF